MPKLKIILIIHLALLMGVLMFAGIVAFITDWTTITTDAGMLPLMAAVTGLMSYAMSFIIPQLVSGSTASIAASLAKQSQTTQIPDQKLVDALTANQMSGRIIAGALLEGGLFLNLLIFFIEPNTVSVAIIGIGVVLFLIRIPLIGRQLDRLENDLSEVKRELQLLK